MARRPPSPPPHLSALRGKFSEVQWNKLCSMLAKLEDFLMQAGRDAYSGTPAPHQDTHLVGGDDAFTAPGTPTTVDAGSTSSAGLGPAPAREDHEHGVTTGAASSLGEANAEGSGQALARAAHIHRLDVRVAKSGTTIGTRKRINLVEGSGASISVADDSSSDQVTVTIASASSQGSSSEPLSDWYTRKAVEAYALRGYNAATYR